jgi:hypothetical protein
MILEVILVIKLIFLTQAYFSIVLHMLGSQACNICNKNNLQKAQI